MPLIYQRGLLLRVAVMVILLGMTYPFLPAKQKWQIQAALGSSEADSLLNEYYEAPVENALQFSIEHNFEIKSDRRSLIDIRDIRYVQFADKVWGDGRLWAIHLRRNAIERLQKQLTEHSDETLWIVLDGDWEWRVPLDISEAYSPIYIDPASFSTDPYFETAMLEAWYERPFIPGNAGVMPLNFP